MRSIPLSLLLALPLSLTSASHAEISVPLAPIASTLAETTAPSAARSGAATLQQTARAFNEVAKKATPAVVSIRAIKTPSDGDGSGLPPFLGPGPQIPGHPGAGGPQLGVGSGVILREDGLILTNHHVVQNAKSISVLLNSDDRQKFEAKLIGADPKTDIAVIQIIKPPGKLDKIGFADSNTVEVGDWAIAIGSPFGLTHSVTSGIVSAKGRVQLGVYDIEDFIQTDAAINPGNSGGPLLNLDGQMIGLNAAIFSQTGGYMGIGFSISANLVRKISDEIIAKGKVTRGYLGLAAQDMDKDLAEYFRAGSPQGALVSGVDPSGPAGKSGEVRSGDVIRKFNNQPVKDATDLRAVVNQAGVGTKAPVEIVREGRTRNIILTVGESPDSKPAESQMAGQVPRERNASLLGFEVNDIPSELVALIGLKAGDGALVTSVEPGSAAFEAGMSPGDVILTANEKPVRGAESLKKLTAKMKSRDLAVFYVQRGPQRKVYVPIRASSG